MDAATTSRPAQHKTIRGRAQSAKTPRGIGAAGAALLLAALLAWPAGPALGQAVGIAAIVNDELISAWDVDQRFQFYRATGDKSADGTLRERSLTELINELLMRQEAKRLGVSVEDASVRSAIDARLKPVKSNYGDFDKYLRGKGVRISTLENRMRAQLVWRQVIQRTYRDLVTISETDIDAAVEGLDGGEAEETFALKRILLKVPASAGDGALGARLADAEKIRTSIRDCTRIAQVLARFRDTEVSDLPGTKTEDLKEPTRSLVLQATEGQVTPPNPVEDGLEMIVVCQRTQDGGKRQQAQRQLVNQEFEMLAERHLRDTRQDAIIEYR